MNRQQQWAETALGLVTAQRPTPDVSKYKTLCMKGPGLIQASGLAQGIVFLLSRERAGAEYVRHLATILGEPSARALLTKALTTNDLDAYLVLTTNVISAAAWLRRFAQIELSDKSSEGATND